MFGSIQRRATFEKFRRPSITLILCVLILGVGGWVFDALSKLKAPPPQRDISPKVYNVEVFDAQRVDLPETLVGYGTAQSDREVTLAAQVTGEIVEVHPSLRVGAEFKAAAVTLDSSGRSQRSPGDVLLRIDSEPYQQKLAQAESKIKEDEVQKSLLEQQEQNNTRQLDRARTDVKLYEEELGRVESLRKQGVGSDSDVTSARLQLQRYKESLITLENEHKLFPIKLQQVGRWMAMHQNDRTLVQLDIEHTTVRPPFNGTLRANMVELGQHVRVGDPLVKLIDVSIVEVPVSLPLTDYTKLAAKVRGGERPRVSLAENETAAERWHGHVVRVSPQADELTRTVRVYVRVENATQTVPLLPGTFVYARISGPVLQQALIIPRDCIVNGKVFLAEKGRAVHQDVSVADTIQSLAVIAEGIAPGAQVIMTNLDVLYDTAQIRIQSRRDLDQELKQRRTFNGESLAGPGPQQIETR